MRCNLCGETGLALFTSISCNNWLCKNYDKSVDEYIQERNRKNRIFKPGDLIKFIKKDRDCDWSGWEDLQAVMPKVISQMGFGIDHDTYVLQEVWQNWGRLELYTTLWFPLEAVTHADDVD